MQKNSLGLSIRKIEIKLVFKVFKVIWLVGMMVGGGVVPVAAQSDSPLPVGGGDMKAGQVAPKNDVIDTDVIDTDEAAQPTVTVTRAACRELVVHVPDDDVAYKPGVDVYGRDVAPADLNGGHDILKSLPKEIEFPVTVDFFDYVGLAVPDGISGEQNIGRITYRNGRVYFNDIALGDGAGNAEVIAACRKAGFD